MVGALGAEVDRLETEIQQLMPGIRHIDLVRQHARLFWLDAFLLMLHQPFATLSLISGWHA